MMVAENGNGTDGVSTAAPNNSYVNRDELLSLRVVVGAKRIFLALCENDRGRYLKISDGRSKLIVPGSGITDLRTSIDSLHAYFVENPEAPPMPAPIPEAENGNVGGVKREPLSAERFISEGRKFYLDLLCNDRGMYVKMSQATIRRVSMIFPAAALSHLQDAMTQLHDLAPPDHSQQVPELAPGQIGHTTRTVERQTTTQSGVGVVVKAVQRVIRTEGKRLVFESGANRRGSYMRISDNSGLSKLSVTIPHGAIPAMIALLQEVQESGDPIDGLRAAEAAAEATGTEQ